jgi:SAM-dependent methyltransferase
MLEIRAPDGLHDFVVSQVLPRFHRQGDRAVDLGAGSGALVVRLRQAGWDALGVDLDAAGYKADAPFMRVDLNEADFASQLGLGSFELVTSFEVIEHVESPIGFLRNVGRLLTSDGVAVLTTPNLDSAPARLKFLLKGTIRMMDAQSERTHITPIFWDLFTRQYLSLASVQLVGHDVFPRRGYNLTRPGLAQAMQLLSYFLGGEALQGDNHVIVLKAEERPRTSGVQSGGPDEQA